MTPEEDEKNSRKILILGLLLLGTILISLVLGLQMRAELDHAQSYINTLTKDLDGAQNTIVSLRSELSTIEG